MRKIKGICSVLLCLAPISYTLAQTPDATRKAVLYNLKKYETERRVNCVNFAAGAIFTYSAHCDLAYGNGWVGEERDWFHRASGAGDRSVLRDLGAYEWSAKFEVPVVEPLAKLKPGEMRSVIIDASGADGADPPPRWTETRADNGKHSLNAPTYSSTDPRRDSSEGVVPPPPPRPRPRLKHDGKPKVDPSFLKVIPSHIYVAHVVDDTRDFYALFRVEALERGDNCTVTWKLIPAPAAHK